MKSQKNSNKGITLIALVVTIVVLLILAGVSINMLTGENGIIIQAQKSTIKNENGNVYEALQLKVSEYKIFDIVSNNEEVILGKLKAEGYVNEDNTLNAEKLTDQKMKTGKGSIDKGDVYILKNVDNDYYDLIYYTKENEETNIGKAFYVKSDEDLIATSEDYFEYDEETNGIALKNSRDYYNDYEYPRFPDRELGLKTIVIPSTYEGKPVKTVGIDYENEVIFGVNLIDVEKIVIPNSVRYLSGDWLHGAFSYCRNLKSIVIPNTVRYIGSSVFEGCTALKEIRIPEGVMEVGSGAFYDWTEEQTIYLPFKEGQIPERWASNWDYNCKAKIVYEGSEYERFTPKYLADKSKEELEELTLKSLHYLGTFDEWLKDNGKTIEDFELEASNMGMSYTEYLKYGLQNLGNNSWVYIEYLISTWGLENKSEEELENILIKDIIGEEKFNKILEEKGVTKEQLFEELYKENFRSKKDLLKYLICII